MYLNEKYYLQLELFNHINNTLKGIKKQQKKNKNKKIIKSIEINL